MAKLYTCSGILLATVLLSSPFVARARDESRFTIDEYGWELIQSDGVCTARAFFDGPEGSSLVELRKRTPSDFVEAWVVGAGLSKPAHLDHRLVDWKPTYRLTQAEPAKEITSVGWLNDQRNRDGVVFRMSVNKEVEADNKNLLTSSPEFQKLRSDRFAEIEGIYLENFFGDSIILETGSLGQMMKLMDTCTDKLVEGWGISVATERNLSRKARPADTNDMARRVSARYPYMMQELGTAEIVDIRLMIDARGTVTDCVTNPSANPRFAEPTCSVLKEEVLFEPALNAEGDPVASYYLNTIFFIISAS